MEASTVAETLELLQNIVFYNTPPKVKQSMSTLSFLGISSKQLVELRSLANEVTSDHFVFPEIDFLYRVIVLRGMMVVTKYISNTVTGVVGSCPYRCTVLLHKTF